MADGALSWLAMVAARYFADGSVAAARRARARRARSICYRPYACADGWVTLGALEPKFWQAWCRGVGREDLIEQPVRRARLATPTREVEAIFAERTRAEWAGVRLRARLLPGAGARARRGARLRARARARDGRRARPARRRAPGAPARRAGQARAHARRPDRAPGPGARRAHRRGAARRWATATTEIAALEEAGAVAGPADGARAGAFLAMSAAPAAC